MLRVRLSLLALVALPLGCTQIKAVTATSSASPAATVTPVADGAASEAATPTPAPSPTPTATPTPQPTPQITLVAPTNGQDFAANSIDISFTAQAQGEAKISSAQLFYNGVLLTTINDPGPVFKVAGWNPNVVNSLAAKPDNTPVAGGDKSLAIVVTDDKKGANKLEFNFRKPLLITGWEEQTAMPGPTSHFGIFGDGAQPPAFISLWGSVDGIETTVFPRSQSYVFDPTGVGTWSTATINGSSVPRAAYGWATSLNGQLAYIVGGRTGTQDLRSFEVFSPLRKVGEQSAAAMTVARRDAAVAVTSDNFVYAIGGKTADTPVYDVERVQLAQDGNPTGDWKGLPATLSARAGATAIQQGKQIWLFGGGFRPIEVFDPAANAWSYLTGPDGSVIGTPEAWANSLMLPVGDRIYFFGGEKEDGTPITNIYEFNPAAKSWRTVGPLPTSNVIPAAEIGQTRLGGFFLNGSFYIMGGEALPGRQVTKRVFKGQTL